MGGLQTGSKSLHESRSERIMSSYPVIALTESVSSCGATVMAPAGQICSNVMTGVNRPCQEAL